MARRKRGRKTAKKRVSRKRTKKFTLGQVGAIAACATGGTCDLGFMGLSGRAAKKYVTRAKKAFKKSRARRRK